MARHVLLVKSHVDAFTRKDGTFVAAHDDKRTKAAFSHSPDKWNPSHARVKGDGHNSLFYVGSKAENMKAADEHASNLSAVHAAGRFGEMDNTAKTLAKKHADFDTLENEESDSKDFGETSRQSMKKMLHEAYKSGGGKAGKGADKAVSDAAKHHLMMDDLSDTNSGADFQEVSKTGVKNAVHHAFAAGHASANKTTAPASDTPPATPAKDSPSTSSAYVSRFSTLESAKRYQSNNAKPTKVFHHPDGGFFVPPHARSSSTYEKAGHKVALHYNGKPPSPDDVKKPSSILVKSHVSAFTRKDGTFVAAHDDKRTKAAKPAASTKSHGIMVFSRVDNHGTPETIIVNGDNPLPSGKPRVFSLIPDNKNLKKGDPVSGKAESLANHMYDGDGTADKETRLALALRTAYSDSNGDPKKVLRALNTTARNGDWEIHSHSAPKEADKKEAATNENNHGIMVFTQKNKRPNGSVQTLDHLGVNGNIQDKDGNPRVYSVIPEDENTPKGGAIKGVNNSLSNHVRNSNLGTEGNSKMLRSAIVEAYKKSGGDPKKVLAAIHKATGSSGWEVHRHEPSKKPDA